MSEDNGGSGVNALAIVAILLILVVGGFFVLHSGVLSGGNGSKTIDVNIKAPSVTTPAK